MKNCSKDIANLLVQWGACILVCSMIAILVMILACASGILYKDNIIIGLLGITGYGCGIMSIMTGCCLNRYTDNSIQDDFY